MLITQIYAVDIEDGGVGAIDRLMQPVPTEYVTRRVCDVVPPSLDVTREMLLALLTRGIKLEEFVRLVGVCSFCKSLVALCVFPEHDCIRPFTTQCPLPSAQYQSVPSACTGRHAASLDRLSDELLRNPSVPSSESGSSGAALPRVVLLWRTLLVVM